MTTHNNEMIEEAFAKVGSIVALMPEDKRHKYEKQLEIMKLSYSTACTIADTISQIPPPEKKRIFPSYDRTPMRRHIKLEKKQRTVKLIMQSAIAAFQAAYTIHFIAARPRLKQYPLGAPSLSN